MQVSKLCVLAVGKAFSHQLPLAAGHQGMALLVTIPTTPLCHYMLLILFFQDLFIHASSNTRSGRAARQREERSSSAGGEERSGEERSASLMSANPVL